MSRCRRADEGRRDHPPHLARGRAQAAGLALMEHTDFSPEKLVHEALAQAARLCIYTNDQIVLETLGE